MNDRHAVYLILLVLTLTALVFAVASEVGIEFKTRTLTVPWILGTSVGSIATAGVVLLAWVPIRRAMTEDRICNSVAMRDCPGSPYNRDTTVPTETMANDD